MSKSHNFFTYLYPENSDYPKQMLQFAFQTLRGGGAILLDYFNYAKRIPGIELQQWIAFPKSDPFSYGLYSHRVENNVNLSKSIFIRRDGNKEETKIELCKVYSLQEISQLLIESGFVVEEIFCNFNEDPFLEKLSDRLVIVARKPFDSTLD